MKKTVWYKTLVPTRSTPFTEQRGDLNRNIFEQLREIVEADPLLDLSPTLRRLTQLYEKSLQQQEVSIDPSPNIVGCGVDPPQPSSEKMIPETSGIGSEIGRECSIHGLTLYVTDLLKFHDFICHGEIIWEMGSRKVLRLNDQLVVKSGVGYLSGVDEAELMRFVKKNTSIPVPEVFCVHVVENRYYIFMSYIEGDTLDNKWLSLPMEKKGKIADQLHAFITEMRALPFPHGESLGSLATRRCKDIRRSSFKAASPILTESQFNAFLVSLLKNQQSEYIAMLASSLQTDHKIVLTHGDLHPRNVIVRDGSVVGLIDWEAGGWYPEYWEYVKGLNNVEEVKDWWRYLIRIVGDYSSEWSVDVLIDREIDYKKHYD